MSEYGIDSLTDTVMTILKVSAPLLIISLAIGLIISIFQATTQIHEQTLTFVPKIVGIFLGVAILGKWMGRTVLEFASNLIQNINFYIR